jgi:hypothetical protein
MTLTVTTQTMLFEAADAGRLTLPSAAVNAADTAYR